MRIAQRCLDALLRLSHSHCRQADQLKVGQTIADVNLHQNLNTINTTGSFA